MKTWLIKMAVGILGIAIILAIPAGLWALILSAGGEPVPPALQMAGTCIRAMLGLAAAVTPGVLFWLVVWAIVMVARRARQSALGSTTQDGTGPSQGQYPVA